MCSKKNKKKYKKMIGILLMGMVFLLGVGLDVYADHLLMKYCSSATNMIVYNIKAGGNPKIESDLDLKKNQDKLEEIMNVFKDEDFYFVLKFYHLGKDRMEIVLQTLNANIDIDDIDHTIRIREGKKVIYLKGKNDLVFEKLVDVLRQ
ncbi:MAG: hypothetical protein RR627_09080 [Niameybacter sp.]